MDVEEQVELTELLKSSIGHLRRGGVRAQV